jgi:hypothetical protein
MVSLVSRINDAYDLGANHDVHARYALVSSDVSRAPRFVLAVMDVIIVGKSSQWHCARLSSFVLALRNTRCRGCLTVLLEQLLDVVS